MASSCCGGSRNEDKPVAQEAKFDYVDLRNFRSKSCINYTAYGWIYMSTFISIAGYAADIYTMVSILALKTWSETLIAKNSALIPYMAARIIFTVCICLSFALLGWEWYRAVKVIKRNGVAEAYMNVIALRWSSIHGGSGPDDTGWRRFLLFARLTGARSKLDYVALFTYFSFKGWVRTIFAEGPRVVVNALTIVSVANLQQGIMDHEDAGSIMDKFWNNVKTMWDHNHLSAVTLGTMAFTTILWIIDILELLIAACFFICILWHVMDGASLHNYCKVRIDRRLAEIVRKKYEKELQRDREKRRSLLARQPTVPMLDMPDKKDAPTVPTMVRVDEEYYNSTPGSTTEILAPRLYGGANNSNENYSSTTALVPSAEPLPTSHPSTVYTVSWEPPPMAREPMVPDLDGLDSSASSSKQPMQHSYETSPSPPIPLQSLPPHNNGQSGFVSDRLPMSRGPTPLQQRPPPPPLQQRLPLPQRFHTPSPAPESGDSAYAAVAAASQYIQQTSEQHSNNAGPAWQEPRGQMMDGQNQIDGQGYSRPRPPPQQQQQQENASPPPDNRYQPPAARDYYPPPQQQGRNARQPPDNRHPSAAERDYYPPQQQQQHGGFYDGRPPPQQNYSNRRPPPQRNYGNGLPPRTQPQQPQQQNHSPQNDYFPPSGPGPRQLPQQRPSPQRQGSPPQQGLPPQHNGRQGGGPPRGTGPQQGRFYGDYSGGGGPRDGIV